MTYQEWREFYRPTGDEREWIRRKLAAPRYTPPPPPPRFERHPDSVISILARMWQEGKL